MSEIELIVEQIQVLEIAVKPLTQNFFLLIFGGLFLSIFGLMFGLMMGNIGITGAGVFGVIIIIIALVVLLPPMDEKRSELFDLKEQRNILAKQNIKDMTCDEMRLDIVDKIENDQPKFMEKFYEFEKDLYYHRCEIPLRAEVMKLQ